MPGRLGVGWLIWLAPTFCMHGNQLEHGPVECLATGRAQGVDAGGTRLRRCDAIRLAELHTTVKLRSKAFSAKERNGQALQASSHTGSTSSTVQTLLPASLQLFAFGHAARVYRSASDRQEHHKSNGQYFECHLGSTTFGASIRAAEPRCCDM